MEFFIKGPLAQESEIFNPINLVESTLEEEGLMMAKTQATFRTKRRKDKVPFISSTQWKALEKLSQIPPFD